MSTLIDKLMELGKAYGWNVADYEDRRTTETLDAMEMAEQEFRAALESALPKNSAADVLAERQRQIEANGYTPEHDDKHVNDEIAALACFYAMPPGAREWDTSSTGYGLRLGDAILPHGWASVEDGDRRRELVKAGALIQAEIERLDRAAEKGGAA